MIEDRFLAGLPGLLASDAWAECKGPAASGSECALEGWGDGGWLRVKDLSSEPFSSPSYNPQGRGGAVVQPEPFPQGRGE